VVNIWGTATTILEAVQGDLTAKPHRWENAEHSLKNLRLLIPRSLFQKYAEGEKVATMNWRVVQVEIDLGLLEFELSNKAGDGALKSVLSLLSNVRALAVSEHEK
jgi:hypothetical protein